MTTAICLSGGGAKGDFELGALRLLYDRGVRPDVLCSTSVGSVNAVKLAEGEDPARPDHGLSGLERQWESLQRNSDMYLDEPWLHDAEMDTRVRDALTGRSHGLGITGPEHGGGRWGVLDPVVDFFNDVNFVINDGGPLLKSLNVMANRARALYNLGPIRTRLSTELDRGAVAAWAAAGGRLRMATVALESGNLRYVTETGGVVERDGRPVMHPGPLGPTGEELRAAVEAIEQEISDLQADLRDAAPGEKAAIVQQIRRAQGRLREAAESFDDFAKTIPPVELTVDLSQGVIASAAIPGIFPPEPLGDECYVDGGVRELLPIQAAVDLGASLIYAVSAARMDVTPRGSFRNAKLADILARSVEDLLLNEVGTGDTQPVLTPGVAAPQVMLIAPDFEIHDVTTIDPGLVQINRDYGYMRAADVIDNVPRDTRRWALANEITATRREVWGLENLRYGHEDPTRLADGTPAPDPAQQQGIDAGKARLRQLLDERRTLGAPMPPNVDRWAGTLELHPWTGMVNDAAFVSQSVPSSLAAGASTSVSVTVRNAGTTTWTAADGYALGSQSPQDNTLWGTNRQLVPGSVAPGQEVTFTFLVTTPRAPGAPFQWRMVQESREWFGAITPVVGVTVTEPAECAVLSRQATEIQDQIAALRASLEGLDPKNVADRGEIREIRAQISALQHQLQALGARKDLLGCA